MTAQDSSTSANLNKVRENIRTGVDRIDAIKKKRQELNTDSATILQNLENDYGIHRDAVRLAIKVRDMDAEVREQFLIALSITLESVGLPMQGELFDSAKGLNRLEQLASEKKKEGAEADDGEEAEEELAED